MGRNKLEKEFKKPKIGITLDKNIDEIMCDYLKVIDETPSKYIEGLIKEDMIKRGYEIKNDFEK